MCGRLCFLRGKEIIGEEGCAGDDTIQFGYERVRSARLEEEMDKIKTMDRQTAASTLGCEYGDQQAKEGGGQHKLGSGGSR